MVSFMSWTSARSSGVPKRSMRFARSRRTGWPIRSTSRTAMAIHHSAGNQPDLSHGLIDDPDDIVEGHALEALAASGGRVDAHGDGRVGHLQLPREGGFRHDG